MEKINLTKVVKKIRSKIRYLLIGHLSFEHEELSRQMDELKLVLGKIEARSVVREKYDSIHDAEFRIFSQFGEDGIIQYLIKNVKIKNKTFIEFGVGDYSESNTRFLLENNNWQGLIIDGGREHIAFLRSNRGKDLLYRNSLTTVSTYLTKENINTTIEKSGFSGEVGLLSIDVDGMDYWLLNALNSVTSTILILEYNSLFGNKFAVTVPYKKDFNRTKAHYSNLYFGASLKALVLSAAQKGYAFVGSNSAGNNAFFVKREALKKLKTLSVNRGYVKNSYRESLDKQGRLTYTTGHREKLNLLKHLPLFDVEKEKVTQIKDLYGL